MYFHPLDEYTYYHGGCVNNQRGDDRSASHFGRFAPQSRPLGCAICNNGDYYDYRSSFIGNTGFIGV